MTESQTDLEKDMDDPSVHGDGLGNLYRPEEIEYDGMPLATPERRLMKAVYRSGVLLGIFCIRADAQKFLDANSSIRMVEDHGFQFRIVPVHVDMTVNPFPEGVDYSD